MRVVGQIPHPACKITLFHWNNRYLIKFEAGHLEQTFKVDQFSIGSEQDLEKIVNEEFIKDTLTRFEGMNDSFIKSLQAL